MSRDNSTKKTGKDIWSKYFHAEAAAAAGEDAGAAYQVPSLVTAGADAQHASVLSAMLNLPVALLYFRLPGFIRRVGSRKRAIVMMSCFDAFAWIPLIAAMYFLRPVTPPVLIVLWVFNLLPGVLTLPIRDSWIADKIPLRELGRHLGIRTAISATAYLGVFYMMGYILDYFSGEIFVGFLFILAIALAATLTKAVLYSRIRDDYNKQKTNEFRVTEFLQETRKDGLGRFILYVSLFYFAVFLCSPLFAVYMIKHLNFSYLTFALVFSSEFIGRVISAYFWGKYSGGANSFILIKKASYLIPAVPLLWLVSSNIIYLIGVQLFSGIIWAGFDICTQRLVYAASPVKRDGYIIYKKALLTMCQGLGALTGAGILLFVVPILGQKIFGMFLLSSIARFVIAFIMLPKMNVVPTRFEDTPQDYDVKNTKLTREPEQVVNHSKRTLDEDSAHSENNFNTARNNPAMAMSKGLRRFSPSSKPTNSHLVYKSAIDENTNDSISGGGLYYKPKEWGTFLVKHQPKESAASPRFDAVISKRGLYYKPAE